MSNGILKLLQTSIKAKKEWTIRNAQNNNTTSQIESKMYR